MKLITKLAISRSQCLIGLILLFAFVALPSGVGDRQWNGLPWTRPTDTFLIVIIIPLLLIANLHFLSSKKTCLILWFFLLIKISFFFIAPLGGLNLRIFESINSYEERKWEINYGTFWHPDVSDVYEKSYNTNQAFPIEWIHRYDFQKQRDDLEPVIEMDGYLRGSFATRKLAVLSVGAGPNSWVELVSCKDRSIRYRIPIFQDRDTLIKAELSDLPPAVYELHAVFFYTREFQKQAELAFLSVNPKHQLKDLSGSLSLFRDIKSAQTPELLLHLKKMVRVLNYLFVYFFLGLWILMTFYGSQHFRFFSFLLVGICISLCMQKILRRFGILPSMVAGLSLLPVQCFFLYFLTLPEKLRSILSFTRPKDGLLMKFFILLMGVPILFFFASQYSWLIERMRLFTLGDDWLTYQRFGRMIALGGEWLRAGEGTFTYQPLYRYCVAVLHILFGQSNFPQFMLDVWTAIIGSVCVVAIVYRLLSSFLWAFLAGFVCIDCFTIGVFRHHIGAGLQEYVAMALQMSAILFAVRVRDTERFRDLFFGGIFTMLGFWGRPDHIFILASSPLLIFTRKGNTKFAMRSTGIIWLFLLLAIFMQFLHNYYFGNLWGINTASNMNQLSCGNQCLKNIWDVLTAHAEDQRFEQFPVIILVVGIISGIATVAINLIRKILLEKPTYIEIPWQFSVILFSSLLPYFFLRTAGYALRFSIHIVPLACISLALIGASVKKNGRVSIHGLVDSTC